MRFQGFILYEYSLNLRHFNHFLLLLVNSLLCWIWSHVLRWILVVDQLLNYTSISVLTMHNRRFLLLKNKRLLHRLLDNTLRWMEVSARILNCGAALLVSLRFEHWLLSMWWWRFVYNEALFSWKNGVKLINNYWRVTLQKVFLIIRDFVRWLDTF